ncbi:glycosyltransferase [Pedobacter sp. Du54]|uniref:XrtY-associated glycosyltransferase XYAG1 n=1 Tax=Pedobacter anseongensis TaxID=3133439 RepID=UPI003095B87F
MKIIQITPSYKPAFIYGGPTMSVAQLCEALVDKNLKSRGQNLFDFEVFTTTANGPEELNVEVGKQVIVDGVPVTYFKRITKDHTHFSPALLFALHKKIRKQKTLTPKSLIIHIHSWWNLVAVFSCFIAKLYRIPVILSPRGMITDYTQTNRNSILKSALHLSIGKSLLKYCHIIASTELEKENILQYFPEKNISVIPNLVKIPKNFGLIEHTQNDVFSLIFLSRIQEVKGLDILFNSLATLNFPWNLTIAGTGNDSYLQLLKTQAEKLQINGKISWVGHVNNDEKFKLLAKHDLMILTSHTENFANVVIESLSVGTPVFLSSNVGLSRYVNDNDLGFITNLDIIQISAKLQEAYLDFNKRNQIRLVAPRIIERDFNDEVLIKKYLMIYQQNLDKV